MKRWDEMCDREKFQTMDSKAYECARFPEIQSGLRQAYRKGRWDESDAWRESTDAALIDAARKEANGAVEAARERVIEAARDMVRFEEVGLDYSPDHNKLIAAVRALDALQQPDEPVECEHEGDGLTYVTMPRQFKCKKCRQFVKDRRTGEKDRRKWNHDLRSCPGNRKNLGRGRRVRDSAPGSRKYCCIPWPHSGECRPDAPTAVGDWGEPWVFDKSMPLAEGIGRQRDGERVQNQMMNERAVACVNALAGKRPELLGELLEACHVLTEYIEECGMENEHPVSKLKMDLQHALAAFEGETE